jgi:hypothetical protein
VGFQISDEAEAADKAKAATESLPTTPLVPAPAPKDILHQNSITNLNLAKIDRIASSFAKAKAHTLDWHYYLF